MNLLQVPPANVLNTFVYILHILRRPQVIWLWSSPFLCLSLGISTPKQQSLPMPQASSSLIRLPSAVQLRVLCSILAEVQPFRKRKKKLVPTFWFRSRLSHVRNTNITHRELARRHKNSFCLLQENDRVAIRYSLAFMQIYEDIKNG